MPRRFSRSSVRKDRVWITLNAAGISIENANSLSGNIDLTAPDRALPNFIAQGATDGITATRPFTILASHMFCNVQGETEVLAGAQALGIQGSMGNQAADLPIVLADDVPKAFPLVVPLMACGLSGSSNPLNVLYSLNGGSKARRKVGLGQTLYLSRNLLIRSPLAPSPQDPVRVSPTLLRILCAL